MLLKLRHRLVTLPRSGLGVLAQLALGSQSRLRLRKLPRQVIGGCGQLCHLARECFKPLLFSDEFRRDGRKPCLNGSLPLTVDRTFLPSVGSLPACLRRLTMQRREGRVLDVQDALELRVFGLELRDLPARGSQVGFGDGGIVGGLRPLLPELLVVARQQLQVQRLQVGVEFLVPARQFRLAFKGRALTAQFINDVGDAGEVGLRALELAGGIVAADAVLADSRDLLEQLSAVLRADAENRVNLALADDGVGIRPDAGAQQQIAHITQAHNRLVDQVLALTSAEETAGDIHFGEIHGQTAVAVVECQGDFGHREGPARIRAGEDDILRVLRPQRPLALLAEHPQYRVADVALADAVGPDYCSRSRPEIQLRGVRKTLEATHGKLLQVHCLIASPSGVICAASLSAICSAYRAHRRLHLPLRGASPATPNCMTLYQRQGGSVKRAAARPSPSHQALGPLNTPPVPALSR